MIPRLGFLTQRTFSEKRLSPGAEEIFAFTATAVRAAFVGGVRSGFLSFGVHEHDAVFGRRRNDAVALARAQRKARGDDLTK
jgi:hypothetical protein